jgi:hypothetical protein
MTSAAFLIIFPEFVALNAEDPTLVTAALARADRRVSDSWGTRRDDVIALTTAHQLALSPWGRNARLVAKDGTTTYGEELKEWKRGHAFARNRIVPEEST